MPYRSIPSCLPLFSLASPTSLVCPKFQSRFWRLDRATDYGALNGLASHRLNSKLIAQNGDDFLRVAGSIKMGKVSASELIRTLQWGSKPSLLARALGELGRIPKTLHLLTFIDDPCYRRDILTQLNRGEGRHRLSRRCFHGQRGELRQRYREGQEDQLGALGLIVNSLGPMGHAVPGCGAEPFAFPRHRHQA
jgi:TnpA family transposase